MRATQTVLGILNSGPFLGRGVRHGALWDTAAQVPASHAVTRRNKWHFMVGWAGCIVSTSDLNIIKLRMGLRGPNPTLSQRTSAVLIFYALGVCLFVFVFISVSLGIKSRVLYH